MFLLSIIFACAVLILAGRFFWAIWVAYRNGELAESGVEDDAASGCGHMQADKQNVRLPFNPATGLPMDGAHFDVVGNIYGTIVRTSVDPYEDR